MNGAEGKCIYIHTGDTFRPDRIKSICDPFELIGEEMLDNVAFGREHNTDQQAEVLELAAEMLTQFRFALIIVDSVTSLY